MFLIVVLVTGDDMHCASVSVEPTELHKGRRGKGDSPT